MPGVLLLLQCGVKGYGVRTREVHFFRETINGYGLQPCRINLCPRVEAGISDHQKHTKSQKHIVLIATGVNQDLQGATCIRTLLTFHPKVKNL
jgi:hypothetical protein